jgi:outer membrane protein
MKSWPAHLFAILLTGTLTAGAEPWTLARALDCALTNSPDARLAQQRINAARAGIEQANAGFWPRLQFRSGYTRTDNPMMVFGSILAQRAYDYGSPPDFNALPDADDFNVKGMVTVPLYAGGRSVAGRRAALDCARAAEEDARAIRNTLAFEVTRTFYTVLKTRQFIRAAEAAVLSYETNLVIAQRRLAAGTLLKSGVLDLEVRLAQAREDLVRARNAHALATRTLRNLLGIERGELHVADRAPAAAAPPSDDPSQRAELAAARQREQAAAAQVRAARSGYLPRVSAFGSLDYDYGWRFNGSGRSYTGGVMAQWDLWDGRLTRGKVREARANLEAAQEQERKLRLNLDLEVDRARLDLQQATERLAVTQTTVAQASESVELTRARFEQGLALPTQLIDAQTALTAARVGRAEAQADRRIAVAALRKAVGWPQLDHQQAQEPERGLSHGRFPQAVSQAPHAFKESK